MSITPPPWAFAATPVSGRAVVRSSALTSSGVNSGRACNSNATAPDTHAADCDVPDPFVYRSKTALDSGYSVSTMPAGTRRLVIDVPGASTSTPRAAVPTAENGASASSAALYGSFVSTEPTVIT